MRARTGQTTVRADGFGGMCYVGLAKPNFASFRGQIPSTRAATGANPDAPRQFDPSLTQASDELRCRLRLRETWGCRSMRLTISVIKADVGSIGGHATPSPEMMDAATAEMASAIDGGFLIDGLISHTGDDIALLMTHTQGEGDGIIELNAPEDAYNIAALLRDNERFAIDGIYSRTHGERAATISAQRLHSIAGKYTGKDDPVAVVRNQGIFPALEELISPFAKAHFIGGDARGSHVMPLMPVPLNTPVTGIYCIPIVSCVGFSIDSQGRFSGSRVDIFDGPAWDEVRHRAQVKAIEMRSQGWSGAAMLPYSELEYGGFRDTIEGLLERFSIR